MYNDEIQDSGDDSFSNQDWVYILKSVVLIGIGNISNILLARMRNVEYKHNKSLKSSLKDLAVKDKHRMMYRGLVPLTIGYSLVMNSI